jgi:hypothetical protein
VDKPSPAIKSRVRRPGLGRCAREGQWADRRANGGAAGRTGGQMAMRPGRCVRAWRVAGEYVPRGAAHGPVVAGPPRRVYGGVWRQSRRGAPGQRRARRSRSGATAFRFAPI